MKIDRHRIWIHVENLKTGHVESVQLIGRKRAFVDAAGVMLSLFATRKHWKRQTSENLLGDD